jgi:hypothetical protein
MGLHSFNVRFPKEWVTCDTLWGVNPDQNLRKLSDSDVAQFKASKG